MTITVGVLIEILLMPLLRLEEIPQRLKFHLKRLAETGLYRGVNLL